MGDEGRGSTDLAPFALQTSLHFLDRSPKYDSEKPYTVRFDTEGKFPYTNIENVKQQVDIVDLRGIVAKAPERFSVKKHGFCVITIPDQMTYEEYDDDEILRNKHLPKILTTVQSNMKAGKIHVLDYRVRKRDATFPIRSSEEYKYLQPSSRVHMDYTAEAVRKTVRGYYGDEAGVILDRPWQVINVWHPIRGPCVDWPLAVCDASTIDFAADAMASDFVDSWGYSENVQVHYSPQHRWYFLKDQMPNELLVFKSADSEEGKPGSFPGTPHGAFENPLATAADLPRQSLEIRLLVTW